MQFAVLTQKFKTNTLVVYCDPDQDPALYLRILKTLVRARKQMPIHLRPDESGALPKSQRDSDVLFVLSTVKNLMPVVKLHENGPQALLITPEDNVVNLFQNQLVNLEKVEGLTQEQYLAKAANIEKETQYLETDDDKDRNKKDT